MRIRQRSAAFVAALMIVGAVVLGTVSAASAQTDYQPSTQSSSIAGSTQSSAQGTALPRTGSNSTIPMTQLGVLLVMAGGLLVIVARKRSHRERVSVDA